MRELAHDRALRDAQPRDARAPISRTRAFTIVELLIVVAMAAILVGLILAALAPARFEATKLRSLSAGRQLFAATLMYASDFDDALPHFGTPGDPYQPVSFFGWTQPFPQSYFRANEWHWASLVVPDYFDAPTDDSIAVLTADAMQASPSSGPAPPRLFRAAFLMTDTAFAAPAYWRSTEPPEDLSLIRGTRTSEMAYPALKALMVEFGNIGLIDDDPRTTSRAAHEADIRDARVLAVTGDGAAAFKPFVTHANVRDAAVERPFGCWSTYLFATRYGLRGRDW